MTFLIAVITLINGMDAYMKEDLARKVVGFNTVTLRRTPIFAEQEPATLRAYSRRPPLTLDDAEWLADRMRTPGVVAVSSTASGSVHGPRGRVLENVRITAASASYFRAFAMPMAGGRSFSEAEAERGLPVAVVGKDVADRVFDGDRALGGVIRIWGVSYRVVGVLEEQGSVLGFSFDQVVIAPVRSPLAARVMPRGRVREITFRVADASFLAMARGEMEGWMRTRHHLRPREATDFEVDTPDVMLGLWNTVSRVMLVAFPALVGISLVVGAVVIMNIMLVSVTERTREIGLRKSLGARSRDVMLQFLVEAGTLSGAGGLIGISLGVLLAALVAALSPLPARVAPWSVGMAIVLGVGVGLGAGLYPAYRASRLEPVAALRKE